MQQTSKWRTYLPYLHLETLRVYNLLADDYKNTISTQTPSYARPAQPRPQGFSLKKWVGRENSQAKLASLRGRGGEKGDDGGRPKPTVPG